LLEKPEAPEAAENPNEAPEEAPKEAPKEEPKEAPEEQPKEAAKETPTQQPNLEVNEAPQEKPKEEPKPTVAASPPAPAPIPAKKSEPAKIESGKRASSRATIQGIIEKAKGGATNAGAWIQSHPLQAGLIGAGVALGSIVVGWVIFRALKGGKDKSGRGRRNHARSINVRDEIMAEFPTNAMERRGIVDEIDWDDEEFLQFLSLLPGVDDILAE